MTDNYHPDLSETDKFHMGLDWFDTIRTGNNVAAKIKCDNGDIGASPSDNIQPLYLAFLYNNAYIVNLLLSHGAADHKLDQDLLFVTAFLSGNCELIQLALDMGANVNAKPTFKFLEQYEQVYFSDYLSRYEIINMIGDESINSWILDNYLLDRLLTVYSDNREEQIKLLAKNGFNFNVGKFIYLKYFPYDFDGAEFCKIIQMILSYVDIPNPILCQLFIHYMCVQQQPKKAKIFFKYLVVDDSIALAKKILSKVLESHHRRIRYEYTEDVLYFCLKKLDGSNTIPELRPILENYYNGNQIIPLKLTRMLINKGISLEPYAKQIVLNGITSRNPELIRIIKQNCNINQVLNEIEKDILEA